MKEKNDDIPEHFVSYAAQILADTTKGLTGQQIIKITASHAVDSDVELKYPAYPFPKMGTSKSTALYGNLMSFSAKKRYEIIEEMCNHPRWDPDNKEIGKLKVKLIDKYGHLNEEKSARVINENLLEQTRHWLEGYPDSLNLLNSALLKYGQQSFQRNLLDDLRLSLELLLKSIFSNNRSLENQIESLGNLLKLKGGSTELTNMFVKLLDYYSKYQNTYVKHNDAIVEEEIEFIFEITASFMKHLVRMDIHNKS